jgi:hypothetical protein
MAPVRLNYPKELRNCVGFGSWLVNAVADCNGCHTGGSVPNLNYAPGGNPYFGQKAKVDPTVYLSGGKDFGQVAIEANFNPIGPHISFPKSHSGLHRAAGGRQHVRAVPADHTDGTDVDHLHPPWSTDANNPNCLFGPPGINPVDGNLLQVMPWPVFNNMSTQDLLAIYNLPKRDSVHHRPGHAGRSPTHITVHV